MMNSVFLDTSYAIALSVMSDAHHSHALELADDLHARGIQLVTTRAVLLEIGNSLSRQRYRPAAVQLLSALDADPQVDCVEISLDLYVRGFDLFQTRPDKSWSLTDCISFVVMEDMEVTEALTADEHFDQAGFRALLRQE